MDICFWSLLLLNGVLYTVPQEGCSSPNPPMKLHITYIAEIRKGLPNCFNAEVALTANPSSSFPVLQCFFNASKILRVGLTDTGRRTWSSSLRAENENAEKSLGKVELAAYREEISSA